MKKLTLLIAGGAGYVLGSRAGRERYEQIRQQSAKAWGSPTVQGAVDDVQAHAKQAAVDLGGAVKDKVVDTVTSSKDDPAIAPGAAGNQQPSTIAPGVGTA